MGDCAPPLDLVDVAIRGSIAVAAILIAFALGVVGARFARRQMGDERWACYYHDNFHFVAGMPLAVVAAFGITVYFDVAARAPMRLEAWGLVFEGPTLPVVLWLAVFLAIVAGIRWLTRR